MSSKEKEPNNVDASPSVDASPPVEDSNEKREANNYLLASTMMRDFAAAKRWLNEGADVNAKHETTGLTPLIYAMDRNDTKMVKLLLAKGADLGVLPLVQYAAVGQKNRAMGHLLLQHLGMELHAAVILGHRRKVKQLLKQGADINSKTPHEGLTPLQVALDKSMMDLLLENGADLEANASEHLSGYTALHSAASHGDVDKVKYLLSKGSNPEALDDAGRMPLHVAATAGEAACVTALLDLEGTNVDLLDKGGHSALLHAIASNRADIVRLLLNRGASPEAAITSCKQNALFAAAARGHYEIVNLLLSHKAHVDVADYAGRTALLIAAFMGFSKICEVLIAHGAAIEHQENDGSTALMLAVLLGKMSAVDLLVRHGANINQMNKDGSTPLIYASGLSKWSSVEMVKYLLEHGANIDLQPGDFCSALMVAAFFGKREAVEVLLTAGADPTLSVKENSHLPASTTFKGMRAIDLALYNGHEEVANLIKDYMVSSNIKVETIEESMYPWFSPLILVMGGTGAFVWKWWTEKKAAAAAPAATTTTAATTTKASSTLVSPVLPMDSGSRRMYGTVAIRHGWYSSSSSFDSFMSGLPRKTALHQGQKREVMVRMPSGLWRRRTNGGRMSSSAAAAVLPMVKRLLK